METVEPAGGTRPEGSAGAAAGSSDLAAAGVRKSYGGIEALKGASLACRFGEVHGLVGENGAGKSTLVKVLAGAVTPDAGTITLRGEELALGTPAAAREAGIGTVFQELSLISDLTVAQNLFYGVEPRVRWGRISQRALRSAAREALSEYDLDHMDVDRPVRDLRLAERQVLEIVKVLLRRPRVLLLDEATSALLPEQVDWLFDVVRGFARDGGLAIFISHRLAEIERLCDRVTVFRGGLDVGAGPIGEMAEERLVELMLGRKVERVFPPKLAETGSEVVCRLEAFESPPSLRPVDLEIRAGEIVGVGGLEGQGQADLFLSLYGCRRSGGTVTLGDDVIRSHTPADALRDGIALVPEDRAREGLCLSLPIRDNISLGSLGRLSRFGFVDGARERRLVDESIAGLQISLREPRQEVSALSGGNQQKVLLSRVLATGPRLLLMYDATRGVDVGTKAEIYRLMREQCALGVAILFYSSDAAELANLADRVIVLHDGAVRADLRGDVTEEAIIAAAVGGRGKGVAA